MDIVAIMQDGWRPNKAKHPNKPSKAQHGLRFSLLSPSSFSIGPEDFSTKGLTFVTRQEYLHNGVLSPSPRN